MKIKILQATKACWYYPLMGMEIETEKIDEKGQAIINMKYAEGLLNYKFLAHVVKLFIMPYDFAEIRKVRIVNLELQHGRVFIRALEDKVFSAYVDPKYPNQYVVNARGLNIINVESIILNKKHCVDVTDKVSIQVTSWPHDDADYSLALKTFKNRILGCYFDAEDYGSNYVIEPEKGTKILINKRYCQVCEDVVHTLTIQNEDGNYLEKEFKSKRPVSYGADFAKPGSDETVIGVFTLLDGTICLPLLAPDWDIYNKIFGVDNPDVNIKGEVPKIKVDHLRPKGEEICKGVPLNLNPKKYVYRGGFRPNEVYLSGDIVLYKGIYYRFNCGFYQGDFPDSSLCCRPLKDQNFTPDPDKKFMVEITPFNDDYKRFLKRREKKITSAKQRYKAAGRDAPPYMDVELRKVRESLKRDPSTGRSNGR